MCTRDRAYRLFKLVRRRNIPWVMTRSWLLSRYLHMTPIDHEKHETSNWRINHIRCTSFRSNHNKKTHRSTSYYRLKENLKGTLTERLTKDPIELMPKKHHREFRRSSLSQGVYKSYIRSHTYYKVNASNSRILFSRQDMWRDKQAKLPNVGMSKSDSTSCMLTIPGPSADSQESSRAVEKCGCSTKTYVRMYVFNQP